jgi:hypothetical protein
MVLTIVATAEHEVGIDEDRKHFIVTNPGTFTKQYGFTAPWTAFEHWEINPTSGHLVIDLPGGGQITFLAAVVVEP